MSIDYDMMLRTDLIVYSKLFCAYFSGLALLRHWLAEPDCANVPQAPLPTPRVTSQRKSIVNHEGTRPSPTPLQTRIL
jgi:hypothetical protein